MDRREEILARILEVLQSITGIVKAARNVDEVSEAARPALLLFDSDEEAAVPAPGNGRPVGAATIIEMHPEILLTLSGKSAEVGSTMNGFRVAVISALLSDSELIGLCGSNGGIRYEGLATGLSRGRSMEGEMGLAFSFRYPLILSEL